MRVIALDLATHCGYAIGEINQVGHSVASSGSWDLSPRGHDSPGMRYLNFRSRLNDALTAYPGIALAVWEKPHHRGAAATAIGAGLVATVQTWCAELGIEHTSVHSSTLKKIVTGRGNASKEEVISGIRRRFEHASPTDDDEADALAVFYWLVLSRL